MTCSMWSRTVKIADTNRDWFCSAFEIWSYWSTEDSELIFIGSKRNAYYEMVKKYADEYNSKHSDKSMRCLVGICRTEMIELLHKADVCVLSSYSEHVPMTILEAMAAGKPFVSTNVGLVKELPGGIVCQDKNKMATCFKELYDSEELRKKLGSEGRVYADEHCRQSEAVKRLESIMNGD